VEKQDQTQRASMKSQPANALCRPQFVEENSCVAQSCGIDSDKANVYCHSRRRSKGLAKIKRCRSEVDWVIC